MTEPRQLRQLDTFNEKGIGLVRICEGEKGLNPRTLPSTVVTVGGVTGEVCRVDTFAVMNPRGMRFGVLLKQDCVTHSHD